MTNNPKRSSSRLSKQGFQPLNNNNESTVNMASPNNPNDIPLQTVVSHTPSQAPTTRDDTNEKHGMFHRRGRRKVEQIDPRTGAPRPDTDDDDEKTAIGRMGKIYFKILNFSIVTRYMIYVAPVAVLLAIPIILASTVFCKSNPGGGCTPTHTVGGANMRFFFIWIEIVWLSFWACKVIAHFLPNVFEFLVGVVSPGVRKYALLLRAVEMSLSVVFWMIVNQVTFPALVDHDANAASKSWRDRLQKVILALLICSCIILGERVLIQLISISYHRKQFDQKIKESKRNIYLLGLLYDASRALFPAYCPEFAEEDYTIQDTLQLPLGPLVGGLGKKGTFGIGKKGNKHGRTGSGNPMRVLQDVGRFGDKVTSVFGTVAQEITGKKILDPNSAHSIVLEALDHNKSAEALARRIWLSFVVEGKDNLYQEDLIEVMGPGRQNEAEECFSALDRDGNGDISLEEMILTVTEFGRERKSIATSMHDVDQAINALDGLLFTIVFVVCVFVFIAFLSAGFVSVLTTSATALLSLSFVFAATCQEILGSCIFLFVKHPYDIGDRVDLTTGTDQLTVEHISLLYTVFKRVQNGKMVQIPNIVLNNLWVENITRSKAMREQVSIFVSFDTTFEDINTLKQEMANFVSDPQNSRDFHSDIEIEVISIAEMNKLELKVEIRHKCNWSNDTLRAARRSKFMCALVVALRKVPIYGPGGGDAALGDAGKPSWSVSISPEAAQAARDQFNADKDKKRMFPTQPVAPADSFSKGKSSSTDYLSAGNPESHAINTLNSRKPGQDHLRDDTWAAREMRDDTSTLGRPSLDGRPYDDEGRGLLHKATSSGGRRKQNATLSPSPSDPRPGMPHLPVSAVPSSNTLPPAAYNNYALPPQQQRMQPNSPSSISTGNIEEFQYQQMMAPPKSEARSATRSPTGSNNPYRISQSPVVEEKHPYKP